MKFKFDPRVLKQLGTELITTDEVAITELIKNSYDAYASEVRINFLTNSTKISPKNILIPCFSKILSLIKKSHPNKSLIIIEDNGKGMNDEELEKGFFTVGSDLKKKEKLRTQTIDNKRIILGDKGLGRLSAQRLSDTLFLETTSYGEDEIFFVEIEWDKLISGKRKKLKVKKFAVDPKIAYTRLWLTGAKIDFEKHIEYEEPEKGEVASLKEDMQSAISFFASPFEEPVEDFDITLWHDNKKIHSDFNSEVIRIAETIHNFEVSRQGNEDFLINLSMEIKPWYLERIHLIELGKELYPDLRRKHSYYADLIKKYKSRYSKNLSKTLAANDLEKKEKPPIDFIKNIIDIAPIKGEIYSFKRQSRILKMAFESALENNSIKKESLKQIKPFLDFHNGIKLYRDKFRIATLGNKDSDWLQLQQARTRGQQYFRFELGNTIGYVKISDIDQNFITEISSRLDIVDSPHKFSLNALLEEIFNSEFYKLSRDAYYISLDILKEEGLLPEKVEEKIEEEHSKSEKNIKKLQRNLKKLKNSLDIIEKNKELNSDVKIRNTQKAVNSLANAFNNLEEASAMALDSIESSKIILKTLKQKEKKIELEAYNNYKLMANGLITETLTHELHSLLPNPDEKPEHREHIKAIGDYLLDNEKDILYSEHLKPVKDEMIHLHSRMSELSRFYSLLENTFLYKGTMKDFKKENIYNFLETLKQRISKRLKDNKIIMEYPTIDMLWEVPRGSLIHIFYNLIDNSLYWINERRRRQIYDKSFLSTTKDKITIEKKDENTICYYDTGTGVLAQYQDKVFFPLVSGKREKGRGMGMYIVRKLLESFDAKIELLPDRNRFGNRFIFAITMVDDSNKEGVDEQTPGTD